MFPLLRDFNTPELDITPITWWYEGMMTAIAFDSDQGSVS